MWIKMDASFPEILVTAAEQVEHGEGHELLHLHRIRGVQGRKLTTKDTIADLLEVVEREFR